MAGRTAADGLSGLKFGPQSSGFPTSGVKRERACSKFCKIGPTLNCSSFCISKKKICSSSSEMHSVMPRREITISFLYNLFWHAYYHIITAVNHRDDIKTVSGLMRVRNALTGFFFSDLHFQRHIRMTGTNYYLLQCPFLDM